MGNTCTLWQRIEFKSLLSSSCSPILHWSTSVWRRREDGVPSTSIRHFSLWGRPPLLVEDLHASRLEVGEGLGSAATAAVRKMQVIQEGGLAETHNLSTVSATTGRGRVYTAAAALGSPHRGTPKTHQQG
jgi:hypothetical protein